MADIDELYIRIESDSKSAVAGVDALIDTLSRLKQATSGLGLGTVAKDMGNLAKETTKAANSNNALAKSAVNVWAKLRMAYGTIKSGVKSISSLIDKSAEYNETINRFNVSMGQYAMEHSKYAEQVGEIMGIDPAEWMSNEATFMALSTGFGIAGDRAATMSQQLTQLGYDIASFHDTSFNDAMLKLQSGLAGELEPLRRIGYDLSVARLQQEAYTLGINKKVSAMTQAEKAELRYYTILKQSTLAQGDMARTLEDPANQLRLFKSQVNQAARAIGNIFIPMLNIVLPILIAVTKVVKTLADIIAGLFNYELPEVTDWGGLSGGANDYSDALSNATDNAKKLQKYTMGFDELNVIDPSSGSDTANSMLGDGGLGFELPTYDFLGEASESKVAKIVEDMKKWLGLTEDIDSWSELFDTNLGQILLLVGEIGLAIGAWKLSSDLISGINSISKLTGGTGVSGKSVKLTLGAIVAFTGITIEWTGVIDAIKNGLDELNFAEILGGGGLTVTGGALIGSALGSTIIGAAVGAIVAGVPAFFVGIYDACVNGIDWLNGLLIPIGSTAAGAGIGAIIGMLGGPVTAGVGALIGLAVGAITDITIWQAQNWDKIKEVFTEIIPTWFSGLDWKKVGEVIGDCLATVVGGLINPFGFIVTLFENVFDFEIDWKSIGEAIGRGFGTAAKFIGEAWSFLNEWLAPSSLIRKVVGVIKETDWGEVWDRCVKFVTKDIPKWWKEIGSQILAGIGKGIWEKYKDFLKDIKDFIDGFVQGFKEKLGIHSSSTVFAEIGGDIVEGLIDGITSWNEDCKKTIVEWATNVKVWFTKGNDGKNIFDHFKTYANDIIGGFKDKIGNTYTTVKENVTTWASKVKSWFEGTGDENIVTKFETYATDIISGFNDKIGENYSTVKDNITTWASSVKSWFVGDGEGNLLTKFTSYATDIVDNFKTEVGNKYTTVRDNMTSWAGKVKSWFVGTGTDNIRTKFTSYATEIVSNFKTEVGGKYTTVRDNMKLWASKVKSWFVGTGTDNIREKFSSYATDIVGKFKDNLGATYRTSRENVKSWAGKVKSWFEGTGDENIFTKFSNFGGEIVTKLSTAVDTGTSSDTYKTIFGRITSALTSVKADIVDVINSIIGYIERMVNGVIRGFNSMITKLNSFSISAPDWVYEKFGISSFGFSIPYLATVTIPRVQLMAEGGFPESGQMFIAREAGPEMVGSIGRRTAVANNEQIVAGIASGVASANSEQNALLREQNTLLRAMLEKESGVYLDGKKITKSVERNQRERGRVLVTGGAY